MKRSNTSSRSSKAKAPGSGEAEPVDLKKTLDEKVLARAREIVGQYSILLRPNAEHGFSASCLEFPTVFVHGKTAAQCEKKLREAVSIGVAVMLAAGQTPPLPATEERRTQQVNIRLTSEEKLLLEETAKRQGYRGLSDYMRSAAMNRARRAG